VLIDGELAEGDGLSGLGSAEFSTDPSPAIDAGDYRINVAGLANDNYAISYAEGDDRGLLTITPRPITLTADSHIKLVGEDDPELTFQLTSGNLVGADDFTGELERDPGEAVDSYTITQGTVSAGTNYQLAFVAGTLSIVYEVCVDFDNDTVKRVGSVIPIRLMLCDSDGDNLSSSDVTVTASHLVKVSSGTDGDLDPDDAGHSNPDNDFRFAGDRYIYNLSTIGMSEGTWRLEFNVDGQPSPGYWVEFQLRQ
jgi:hypothetical protein